MQDLRTLDLQYLPGIGPARAKMLHDQLGLSNWHDLLYYLPYKHIDRTRLYAIRELRADMPFVQVKGWLLGFEKVGEGRKSRLVGHFTDGHDVMAPSQIAHTRVRNFQIFENQVETTILL